MTVLEVLVAARKRIADKRHWTRGQYARDRWGHGVNPRSPSAVRWCAFGALQVDAVDNFPRVWTALSQLASRQPGGLPVDLINDGEGGHAAVLALYDAAIALARAEAQP